MYFMFLIYVLVFIVSYLDYIEFLKLDFMMSKSCFSLNFNIKFTINSYKVKILIYQKNTCMRKGKSLQCKTY